MPPVSYAGSFVIGADQMINGKFRNAISMMDVGRMRARGGCGTGTDLGGCGPGTDLGMNMA